MKTINYFDLGPHIGNEIQTVLDLFDKDFILTIYAIEANPEFYLKCKNRFQKNLNVKLYNFAIGSKTGKSKLFLSDSRGLGSSIYNDKNNVGDKYVEIDQYVFSDWYKSLKITKASVDILKANIEGAEYDLILDLNKNSLFNNFDVFLGDQGWITDMKKVSSLKNKTSTVEKILAKNHITIEQFVVSKNHKTIDLKKRILGKF